MLSINTFVCQCFISHLSLETIFCVWDCLPESRFCTQRFIYKVVSESVVKQSKGFMCDPKSTVIIWKSLLILVIQNITRFLEIISQELPGNLLPSCSQWNQIETMPLFLPISACLMRKSCYSSMSCSSTTAILKNTTKTSLWDLFRMTESWFFSQNQYNWEKQLSSFQKSRHISIKHSKSHAPLTAFRFPSF